MPRPNSRDPETDPAAFFGDELARARLAAGFSSQQALADHLGSDRSVIGKAETGERPPTADVLAVWAKACGADAELFGRMATLARRADGPIPRWFETWLAAECGRKRPCSSTGHLSSCPRCSIPPVMLVRSCWLLRPIQAMRR